jgi:glucokinase
MEYYIAVDIGGTQIRAGLYPLGGGTKPTQYQRISTKGKEGSEARLLNLISEIWPKSEKVIAIGADAPGPIDPETGILFNAPNIPAWVNYPLKQIIADRFNVPVVVANDANAAGFGEWKFGAGQGHQDMLFFTISTGIGGGVISGGKLLLGWRGLAAELGHFTISPDGPLCGCGQKGHLEAYSSGTGIARYIKEQLAAGRASSLQAKENPSAKDASEAAAQGDALAIEALQRAGHYMGIGLATYLHIFNPSIVVLGGGVSRTGPIFYDALHAALKSHVMSPAYLQDLVITQAALGDDAGLMGALALAQATFPMI